MSAKLLYLRAFAGVCKVPERCRAPTSRSAQSVDLANSKAGYVTIHVTKSRITLRDTGNGMRTPSGKASFGQDLVGAMKLILAHHRGEIKLEHVLPKARVLRTILKQRFPRAK